MSILLLESLEDMMRLIGRIAKEGDSARKRTNEFGFYDVFAYTGYAHSLILPTSFGRLTKAISDLRELIELHPDRFLREDFIDQRKKC